MTVPYRILLSETTRQKIQDYETELNQGSAPGPYLSQIMDQGAPDLLTALLQSKQPQIFAESAVRGDGSDWNERELSILGDIAFGVEVTIFDNGAHENPRPHHPAFSGQLVFVPGALLRNDSGNTPADWREVTCYQALDDFGYCQLYRRRLYPVFCYINDQAAARRRKAVVTVPGLGCGQFSGPFHGRLGFKLALCLKDILSSMAERIGNIALVYFDPYREGVNEDHDYGYGHFRVRPLLQGNHGKYQLCPPLAYQEPGDDFSQCDLYSIVAWDHVSWPGNDFYAGARMTDDGVKAAATDVMYKITGVEGSYHEACYRYNPPGGYNNWYEVVTQNRLQLRTDNVLIY